MGGSVTTDEPYELPVDTSMYVYVSASAQTANVLGTASASIDPTLTTDLPAQDAANY